MKLFTRFKVAAFLASVRKFASVLVLAVFAAAMLAGVAAASPRVSAWHETHVQMKSEGVPQYSTVKFSYMDIRASDSALRAQSV